MVRAQRQESDFGVWCCQSLDGMKDRSGIVHHPERIHRHTELLLFETMSDLRRETGAHEEQLLTGTDSESGILNIDDCSELHIYLFRTYEGVCPY